MSFEDVLLRNDVASVKAFFSASPRGAINTENADGFLPLFYACMKPSVSLKVIEELIELGASIDSKGADGETALYTSVFNRRLDVAKLLIAHQAQVNSINGPLRETALHVAARCDYGAILSFLISAGADVDARNKKQETPLFVAAQAGHHETVYLLLMADASAALANEDEKTPLYIASEKEYKHVVVLLKASRSGLQSAKYLADVEWKQRPKPVMSSDQMLDMAATDRLFTESVRKHSSTEVPPPMKPMEVVAIKVPEPKARTHNPLTGESYGPCRSLEEVGYDSAPPIPPELQNRPPARLSRVGGTSMVVGTGTEDGGRVPIRVDAIGGDDTELYVSPPRK